jgi:hypothetical protein
VKYLMLKHYTGGHAPEGTWVRTTARATRPPAQEVSDG